MLRMFNDLNGRQCVMEGSYETKFAPGSPLEGAENIYEGKLLYGGDEWVDAWYHLFGPAEYAIGENCCKIARSHPHSQYYQTVLGSVEAKIIDEGEGLNLLVFTARGSQILERWAHGDPSPLVLGRRRLTLAFSKILKDILSGIECHQHGNLSAQTVMVSNDCATFIKMKDEAPTDDIISFENMVRGFFNEVNTIPRELNALLDILRKDGRDYLLDSINHPILMSPSERMKYRRNAYETLLRDRMFLGQVDQELNGRVLNINTWIDKVCACKETNPNYFHIMHYYSSKENQVLIDTKPVGYKKTSVSFLQFQRNVETHKTDSMTVDEIDDVLTRFFPTFLARLHEVLVSLKIDIKI